MKYEEKYSLGHLSYVFVSQAHPQVIVLMQQDLLLTRVSNAAGLIPEEEKTHPEATDASMDISCKNKPAAALTSTLNKTET